MFCMDISIRTKTLVYFMVDYSEIVHLHFRVAHPFGTAFLKWYGAKK